MDNWDEVRTAVQVARLGTVSGAAEALGVHHATVIRHIDALEGKLGVKLFQRHARGYTATEAGNDLLLVAQTTDDQFAQLAGRLKGRGASVTGELVVTSLPTFSPLLAPILTAFRAEHEELTVRYLTGDRLFRLEYGEAHVAIRAGSAPDQPDNVVQPFGRTTLALYAADVYIDRYGLPKDESEYESHYFVGHESDTRAPMNRWLREKVPENNIVYRTADNRSYEDGVVAGAGLGLLPVLAARRYPNLTQVAPPSDEWSAPLWLVTHVDLHRTAKVQSFLTFLKAAAKDWVLE